MTHIGGRRGRFNPRPAPHPLRRLARRAIQNAFRPRCILMYHAVVPDGTRPRLWSQVEISTFEAQIRYLARTRPVVRARQMADPASPETLPPGCVAVTFDDGYQNNLDLALPVLERHGVSATVFVTAGLVGSKALLWPDQVYERWLGTGEDEGTGLAEAYAFVRYLKTLPDARRQEVLARKLSRRGGVPVAGQDHPRRLLDRVSLKRLADSPWIEVGSHGLTHALLTRVPPDRAREELCASRRLLQHLIGQPVDLVAYPDGAWNGAIAAMARAAGYRAGFTTRFERIRSGFDPLAIPRYPVGGDLDRRAFAQLLAGLLEVRARVRGSFPRILCHQGDR